MGKQMLQTLGNEHVLTFATFESGVQRQNKSADLDTLGLPIDVMVCSIRPRCVSSSNQVHYYNIRKESVVILCASSLALLTTQSNAGRFVDKKIRNHELNVFVNLGMRCILIMMALVTTAIRPRSSLQAILTVDTI